jgi:molybdopterin molybdotransferase
LSACGVTRIPVVRRPRVAVFSTGDELVEPGEELGPGQIYDANRHLLRLLLSRLPIQLEDFGILPDDPARIRTTLERAAAKTDAVITSGGVSVGDADWVKRIVDEMGALQFWKLNLKPGKPLAYGRIGQAVFLGLPGNPVSAVITTLLIARPVLLRLCGCGYDAPPAVQARLADPIAHRPGREEFQRGTLNEQNGELRVSVTGDQSSNRLASFAGANCLIRIPKDRGDLAVGERVDVLLLASLI